MIRTTDEPRWALAPNPPLEAIEWLPPSEVRQVTFTAVDVPQTTISIAGLYALTSYSLGFSDRSASMMVGESQLFLSESFAQTQQALQALTPYEALAKAMVLGLVPTDTRRKKADISTAALRAFTAEAVGLPTDELEEPSPADITALEFGKRPKHKIRTLFELGKFTVDASLKLPDVRVSTLGGEVPLRFLPIRAGRTLQEWPQLRRTAHLLLREANLIPKAKAFHTTILEREFLNYAVNGFDVAYIEQKLDMSRKDLLKLEDDIFAKSQAYNIMPVLKLLSDFNPETWQPSIFLNLTAKEIGVLRSWMDSKDWSLRVVRRQSAQGAARQITSDEKLVLKKLFANNEVQAVWTALTMP